MPIRENTLLFKPIIEFLSGGVPRPAWEIEAELAEQFKLTESERTKIQQSKAGKRAAGKRTEWTNDVSWALGTLWKDGKIGREERTRKSPTGTDRHVYYFPADAEGRAAASSSAPTGKEEYKEGACGQVTHDRRERSIKARNACIRIHGFVCTVCKMDFQDRYGKIGRKFIHVHHILPISGKTGEYMIDPGNDLRPVCPNCHAMLHRSPFPTIDELRLVVKR